jgi:hypothetical protein
MYIRISLCVLHATVIGHEIYPTISLCFACYLVFTTEYVRGHALIVRVLVGGAIRGELAIMILHFTDFFFDMEVHTTFFIELYQNFPR